MERDRALSGITVVAIEQAVAGPMCTVRLADAGARVIQIERKEGDTAMHYDRAVHDTSAYFVWLNRGKESIVLDLKDAADLKFIRKMISSADVFVQNLAPGAAARLGLSQSELTEINPKLIAVDIVGYGQDTDYAQMRAYDMLVQAESGLCSVTGTPETPSKVGVSVADIATGMNAHAAILEAIILREKTGMGQTIEISMFDTLADWMNVPMLHHEQGERETPRVGLAHASIYPYCNYPCQDGEIVIAIQNPTEWQRLCLQVLGKPELVDDPRFVDNPARVKNRSALDQEIEAVFRTMSSRALIKLLEAAKLAWGKASDVKGLAEHPALRRIISRTGGEAFSLAAPALHSSLQVADVPALGEHSSRLRAEFEV